MVIGRAKTAAESTVRDFVVIESGWRRELMDWGVPQ